ncbi:hypothetical protein [Priestia megaterium]|uniref:Uncharacterized protein n=1 Tax=Priestia megaterium TaxID=1404 RepID=A0A6M6E8E9_PRIMG|nr:hypothetical protein [Priestia megaterium]QJX80837.1 hypothetical protein FDZ14_32630 [Priestia megaterium]
MHTKIYVLTFLTTFFFVGVITKVNAKKVLCPNSFLDDYSKKGYLIKEDENFFYVIDALLYEWSDYLNHEYLELIIPNEFIKPFYKPIESNFRDILEGEEWILDFNINSLDELLMSTYFFELYLFYKRQKKETVYNAFYLSLEKMKVNFNSVSKAEVVYNQDQFNKFYNLIHQFFLTKFNVLFFFETQK